MASAKQHCAPPHPYHLVKLFVRRERQTEKEKKSTTPEKILPHLLMLNVVVRCFTSDLLRTAATRGDHALGS
jgi:hypothetical protein